MSRNWSGLSRGWHRNRPGWRREGRKQRIVHRLLIAGDRRPVSGRELMAAAFADRFKRFWKETVSLPPVVKRELPFGVTDQAYVEAFEFAHSRGLRIWGNCPTLSNAGANKSR